MSIRHWIKIVESSGPAPIPAHLFKWVTAGQFDKYLDKGSLPPKRRYAHFIDDRFVRGNSFTDENHIERWSHAETSTMLLRIDTAGIPNKIYPIPGNKTYLRTMGMVSSVHDPAAWKWEPDEIDEYWIEGTLNLKSAHATVVETKLPADRQR